MKILRLYLKNYTGIYSGTGMEEITLDFTKSDKSMILLCGKNGSGKSTIVSQLQPFKDSFDNRTGIIRNGYDGVKEIDIENEGHVYKIKHSYSAKLNKTVSLISKDGIELNKNGLDKAFNEIVERELGINKEYFKIGKIGTNTENFIQLKPADRKKYIGQFVEAIDKFLDAFDVANKKFRDEKKKIDDTSNRLSSYGDVEILKREISNLNTEIANNNNHIETMVSEISEAKTLQKQQREILIADNLTTLNSELSTAITEYNKLKELNDNTTLSVDDAKNQINLKTDLVTSLTADISTLDADVKNKKEKVQDNINKIVEYRGKIKVLSNVSVEELTNKINDSKNLISKLESALSANKLYNLVNDNKTKISAEATNFESVVNQFCSDYLVLTSKTLSDKTNIELLLSTEYKSTVAAKDAELKAKSNKLTTLLTNLTAEKKTKESNLSQLEILNKRPSDCKIDTCPFIVNVLQFKNLPEEIKLLDRQIDDTKIEIAKLENDKTEFSNVLNAFRSLIQVFKIMNKTNIVYQEFAKTYGEISNWYNFKSDELIASAKEYVELINDAVDKINDLSVCKQLTSSLEAQKTQAEESEKTNKFFNDEIKKAEESNVNLNVEITKLSTDRIKANDDLSKTKQELSELNSVLTALTSLNEKKNVVESISTKINLYNSAQTLYNQYSLKVQDKEEKLKLERTTLSSNQSSLKTKEFALSSAESLSKELSVLTKSFDIIGTVKNALDPKSGIPLVFINSYLESVEKIANKLLGIAYNGEFEIKFNVTEKDFFITVRHGESVIEDITTCSQGETALTAISVSLALIERSISRSGFNILVLDEIDGPLDSSNRKAFISIIENQIKELGIEQVFIISHNDVFNYCPLGLVILKNSDFNLTDKNIMTNKDVIFNIHDEIGDLE